MPHKIFISYRRDDSAASALSIGQYLENEFGRKNVFIDIDMRAGVKFPTVLEQRLSECKVMLVLIGPHWLNARDEQGHLRLHDLDDWVRLEISHALDRNITVIPVRVGGAGLPLKGQLPPDIQGLLDHQAASVTVPGFRNEMAGLVRDIRSIPSPSSWRRLGTIAASLVFLLLLAAFISISNLKGRGAIDTLRLAFFRTPPTDSALNAIWRDTPGEWVMYEYSTPQGTKNASLAQYFKPGSVKIYGDRIVFESRYPLLPAPTAPPDKIATQGSYEIVTNVVDCKTSMQAMAKKTSYNSLHEKISDYTWGDPESLNISIGTTINAGSILDVARNIMCHEPLRTPLLQKGQILRESMKFLMRSADGTGDVLYGTATQISNSDYSYELIASIKFDTDRAFTELLTNATNIIGLPRPYRIRADRLQFNCKDRTVQNHKTEHYDYELNLLHIFAPISLQQPISPNQGTAFDLMLNAVCGAPFPKVEGTYDGTNTATYEKGPSGEQRIAVIVTQTNDELNVKFDSGSGGQGEGTGKLSKDGIATVSLESTSGNCPGSYQATIKFVELTATWSYQGKDCGGAVKGEGAGQKRKS
jgi:hypothetical protein